MKLLKLKSDRRLYIYIHAHYYYDNIYHPFRARENSRAMSNYDVPWRALVKILINFIRYKLLRCKFNGWCCRTNTLHVDKSITVRAINVDLLLSCLKCKLISWLLTWDRNAFVSLGSINASAVHPINPWLGVGGIGRRKQQHPQEDRYKTHLGSFPE